MSITSQVEEAMRLVPRSMFLPVGHDALAWQARPVLPSGNAIILGSPQAEALALQVTLCPAKQLFSLSMLAGLPSSLKADWAS